MVLGKPAAEGESPVSEGVASACGRNLSRPEHEEFRLNSGRPWSKAKHVR